MQQLNSPTRKPGAKTENSRRGSKRDIAELHRSCGIYTRPQVVDRILDAIGWRADADLSALRLLEPAAGDGAFVIEAARRLVASCRIRGVVPKASALAGCIRAFEIHRREALRGRSNVIVALRQLGVHHRTATALARAWIVNADFLLTSSAINGYTHAAGNPPYVRWSKVPSTLKGVYDRVLPREMTGGDLFLPFLDRAMEQLVSNGICGFLCSDRWRFMAFASAFRRKWLPRIDITAEDALSASEAFVAQVESYPSILIATRRSSEKSNLPKLGINCGKTLAQLGCIVKVGPALGHTAAYVLQPDENDVEPELLAPWLDGSEIEEGAIRWRGRRVIAMYDDSKKLIDPTQFPGLMARLKRFEPDLRLRSIVLNGAPWFRPIDRCLSVIDWARPKLLIPELAKVPRIALDRSGMIPSHGVYAIFARGDDIDGVLSLLENGRLARALEGIAPTVRGGYVRCYRRFLEKIQIGL